MQGRAPCPAGGLKLVESKQPDGGSYFRAFARSPISRGEVEWGRTGGWDVRALRGASSAGAQAARSSLGRLLSRSARAESNGDTAPHESREPERESERRFREGETRRPDQLLLLPRPRV